MVNERMASVAKFTQCPSPVGPWLLTSDGVALTGAYPESHRAPPDTSNWQRDDSFFAGVRDQLAAYFAGRLEAFTVQLAPVGTVFQKKVWNALSQIRLGHTTTYGALAAHLGSPSASRAVGAANGKNPISLIVPCHRVVGLDGSLTGYAGGVKLKQWLLDHEASMVRRCSGGVTPVGLAAVTRGAMQVNLGI